MCICLAFQKKQKQLDRKHEDSRKALRKQMAIEEGERQLLDDLKSEEKRQAEVRDSFGS